jgi:polyhydroxyalkanoate synthesis regulator phasin
MQQDLEEEKNKAVIQDLAEKVENYKADLKKKDFAIQDLEIMVKEHESALEKKDFLFRLWRVLWLKSKLRITA